MTIYNFKKMLDHNVKTFRRQPLAEISGSLGDLGTFLPILIALSKANSISLTTTLIVTGIYNIVTGLVFGLPLPVQPMKALAAVAIARSLSAGEVTAAGLFVGAAVGLFAVTGLLEWFNRMIPIPVTKGIQVGAGLALIVAASGKALGDLDWLRPSWADNYLWLIAAFVGLFTINFQTRVPYALVLTVLGLVFALVRVSTGHGHWPHLHLWRPYAFVPWGRDWAVGIIDAGLGQLPLTVLNSVISVVALAADLFPDLYHPTVTQIGLSVAAMNLVGIWFGTMPVCHGAGGLAAQHRFGARSGSSIIFLGLVKLVLGLVFGNSLESLLDRFPTAFLSVMVIAAGLELASLGESLNTDGARDVKTLFKNGPNEQQRKQRWMVMIVTAGTLVGFKNDAIGFLAGLCCHFSFQLANKYDERSSRERRGEHEPLLS